jgi:hypothetical protein
VSSVVRAHWASVTVMVKQSPKIFKHIWRRDFARAVRFYNAAKPGGAHPGSTLPKGKVLSLKRGVGGDRERESFNRKYP